MISTPPRFSSVLPKEDGPRGHPTKTLAERMTPDRFHLLLHMLINTVTELAPDQGVCLVDDELVVRLYQDDPPRVICPLPRQKGAPILCEVVVEGPEGSGAAPLTAPELPLGHPDRDPRTRTVEVSVGADLRATPPSAPDKPWTFSLELYIMAMDTVRVAQPPAGHTLRYQVTSTQEQRLQAAACALAAWFHHPAPSAPLGPSAPPPASLDELARAAYPAVMAFLA